MFRLSPLVTATNVSASLIPARIITSSSTPLPRMVSPPNSGLKRWKESLLWSITATVCPERSSMVASIDPTRPHPRITTFTSFLLVINEESCSYVIFSSYCIIGVTIVFHPYLLLPVLLNHHHPSNPFSSTTSSGH